MATDTHIVSPHERLDTLDWIALAIFLSPLALSALFAGGVQ